MKRSRLPVDNTTEAINTWLRNLNQPALRQTTDGDPVAVTRNLADVTGDDIRVTDDLYLVARELD